MNSLMTIIATLLDGHTIFVLNCSVYIRLCKNGQFDSTHIGACLIVISHQALGNWLKRTLLRFVWPPLPSHSHYLCVNVYELSTHYRLCANVDVFIAFIWHVARLHQTISRGSLMNLYIVCILFVLAHCTFTMKFNGLACFVAHFPSILSMADGCSNLAAPAFL